MCDQERAQCIALNDRLIKLIAEEHAAREEGPQKFSNEALQTLARQIWEARLHAFQSEQNMVRAALDLARDLFARAGGDASTLPGPGEME